MTISVLAIIIPLLVAIGSALAVFAVKYPISYDRFYPKLLWLAILAFSIWMSWNWGTIAAHNSISRGLPSSLKDAALKATQDSQISIWVAVSIAVFSIYVLFLSMLDYLLRHDKKQKN